MNPNSKGFPAEVIYDNYHAGLLTLNEAVDQFIRLLRGETDEPASPAPLQSAGNIRWRALLDMARKDGQVAHHDGRPPEACPYSPDYQREAWFEGYYSERLNASVETL